jgi:hypothetical protein
MHSLRLCTSECCVSLDEGDEKSEPKRQLTGGRRKCHTEVLQSFYFYSSTDIVRMIKSRRMRWTGHQGK